MASTDPRPTDPKRRRLPPLTLLRTFEAVGQLTSLRKAAEHLGLSHTVISRQIRDLEAWLGTTLIERGPRGTRLTEDGRRYFPTVTRAFDLLAEATSELRRAQGGAQIRIWCAPGLAARWLAPRLAEIEQALPDTDILLRGTDQRPDLAAGDADVEVIYAQAPDPRWRTLLLSRPRMFPVATPRWLAEHPAILTLADLMQARLIHEDSREQWRRWFEASGMGTAAALDGPRLWDANLTLDAAASDQGIALAPAPIINADLAAGRLVKIIDSDIRLGGYYFATLPSRWNEPAIVKLRTWLEGALRLEE